eukprot:2368219-Prymnesium_polylepis.1
MRACAASKFPQRGAHAFLGKGKDARASPFRSARSPLSHTAPPSGRHRPCCRNEICLRELPERAAQESCPRELPEHWQAALSRMSEKSAAPACEDVVPRT